MPTSTRFFRFGMCQYVLIVGSGVPDRPLYAPQAHYLLLLTSYLLPILCRRRHKNPAGGISHRRGIRVAAQQLPQPQPQPLSLLPQQQVSKSMRIRTQVQFPPKPLLHIYKDLLFRLSTHTMRRVFAVLQNFFELTIDFY